LTMGGNRGIINSMPVGFIRSPGGGRALGGVRMTLRLSADSNMKGIFANDIGSRQSAHTWLM
jgi:hypothetical protein